MRTFQEIRDNYRFSDLEAETLKGLLPVVEPHAPRLIRDFYNLFLQMPDAAKFLQNDAKTARLEGLHRDWLLDLFKGPYDERYFQRLQRVGLAHVNIGLSVHFVHVGMNFLRLQLNKIIEAEVDPKLRAGAHAALAKIPEDKPEERLETKGLFYKLEEKLFRELVLKKKLRTDGRGFDDIRPITAEVGLLTRTHGSALFTRGETQALATVTLGTFEDAQRLDSLGEESKKRFMLHYNFPPFSVGEVGFLRAPGRREIGHGALAEKSIVPAIPDMEKFPYTIRIVSDILESNGSSSMATVCGGVLALMDAGVPLKMVVAGIAMGLVSECDEYAILTDIAGLEDHFGDMDFKMAGTEKGVTAIQLDLKIPCVTLPLLHEIVAKSRAARLKVLAKMKDAIAEPRKDISAYAPRIIILNINPEKVGEVIGPAGKIIKKIISQTGAKIDIEEDGKILIASTDMSAAEAAKQMILDLTAEAELGKVYTGKVVRLEEYGAFVEIMPNLVGLLHISEVAPYRIASIHDVLHLGDTVTVKVVNIDPADNKIRLSKKACEEGGGENPDSTPRPPAPAPRRYPREHGPDRRGGGDRGRGGRGRF